jgi:uncharacterized Zn-finger protein
VPQHPALLHIISGLISSLPCFPNFPRLTPHCRSLPIASTRDMEAAADKAPNLEPAARHFQCSTCKRAFTRVDHLTRHVRARKVALKLTKNYCLTSFGQTLARNHTYAPTAPRDSLECMFY